MNINLNDLLAAAESIKDRATDHYNTWGQYVIECKNDAEIVGAVALHMLGRGRYGEKHQPMNLESAIDQYLYDAKMLGDIINAREQDIRNS